MFNHHCTISNTYICAAQNVRTVLVTCATLQHLNLKIKQMPDHNLTVNLQKCKHMNHTLDM